MRGRAAIDTFDVLGQRLPKPLFVWNPVPETAFTPDARSRMTCVPGGGAATARIPVAHPVLLSAIDPVAEDRLVDLGGAVTSGRMLTEKDRPFWGPDSFDLNPVESERRHDWQVPVILSSRALTAGTLDATVQRLDVGDPSALGARLSSPKAHDFVNALKGRDVGPGDGLVARTRPAQPNGLWTTTYENGLTENVPEENTGTQFREVTAHASTECMASRAGPCPASPRHNCWRGSEPRPTGPAPRPGPARQPAGTRPFRALPGQRWCAGGQPAARRAP